jgi:hypothetical protein
MNPLPKKLATGTVGELLVQLRLLQFDVQAAPPLKDTGNDLFAIRGKEIRALQIKTTANAAGFRLNRRRLPARYHALVLVWIDGEVTELHLDYCRIYLLPKSEVNKWTYSLRELEPHKLSAAVVDNLFAPEPRPAGKE